jgi:conjugative transfer signal peptidase TraF
MARLWRPLPGEPLRSFAKRLASSGRKTVPGLAIVVCAGVIGTLALRPRPLLMWNASASSPRGLYLVTSVASLRRGDMAVAWPPATARRLAAERHYLPAHVPLVKRVAAVAGDRVCATRARIRINGRVAAARRRADLSRRPMPRWSGCQKLTAGQVLLLGTAGPDSFDGRYFGPSEQAEIVGKARKLWPR